MSNNHIIQPKYDAFFKFNLEKREIAQAYLQQVVPKELAALSDFARMQLEPSEHIDPELRKLISDVLWSVPIKNSQYYAYFLCEHESGLKDHELLAFRFHKYIIRIMEKHLAKGYKKLPIVIPILLFHGTTKGYPHSLSIYDCFEIKSLAQKYAFRDLTLVDLTTMNDRDIANQGFRFFFELVLKYARDEKLAYKLVESLTQYPHLTRYFDGQDFKQAFVNLLMSLDLDAEHAASETLKKLDDLTGVNIMTLREQWETKAQQQGIQQGLEQGLEQGAIQKARETALNLSRMGLTDDKIIEATGLEQSMLNEIKKLSSKITKH